jgi:predicted membrane protein
MLPSHADRRTWLPVLLVIVLLVALAALVGAGPWMVANLAPLFNNALRALAIVLAISAAVHLVVLLPALLLQRILSQALGLKVI